MFQGEDMQRMSIVLIMYNFHFEIKICYNTMHYLSYNTINYGENDEI